jgi:hypothetical protein
MILQLNLVRAAQIVIVSSELSPFVQDLDTAHNLWTTAKVDALIVQDHSNHCSLKSLINVSFKQHDS